MGKGKNCKKCHRKARRPGPGYCAKHSRELDIDPYARSTSSKFTKKTQSKEDGGIEIAHSCMWRCIAPQVAFDALKRILHNDVIPNLSKNQLLMGCRTHQRLVNPRILSLITPHLMEMVKGVPTFPLSDVTILPPTLVIAPKNNIWSSPWTHGVIHRDSPCMDHAIVYTFLLFIDDVTGENGPVQFWHRSEARVLNERHPKTAINGLSSELLQGPRGTLFAWDSRALHRSLPNKTSSNRMTLQWFVTKKGTSLDVVSDEL